MHFLGEKQMNTEFKGIKLIAISELGISQIYLNEKKIEEIEKWFNVDAVKKYPPLPVHDFGDGRYTLTDGHSRAYVAYKAGVTHMPIVYDYDDIVTSDLGLLQYSNNIEWCKRHKIFTVADFENRIVSDSQYKKLWVERCDKSYNLLTQTTEEERKTLNDKHNNLFLYGSSEDLSVLNYEDNNGKLFEFKKITG